MPAPNAIVIAGYEAAAAELIDRYALIPPDNIYQPVLSFIPEGKDRSLLDIGSGTGRNAAWFADMGYDVTAVEPVKAFRENGQNRYADRTIRWLNDRLPALADLRQLDELFDVITITAVWHHLLDGEQRVAMRQLAGLTRPGSRVFLTLRHGPEARVRPCYPISIEETITQAKRNGFALVFRDQATLLQDDLSSQPVEWTWLVLDRLA